MPGRISRRDVDEVKARVNIADVIGDYVTLKSAGVGALKGLCPFHDERSPSFNVRPQVGRYHCFGCGEDGDAFEFLVKMDHVTFQEAVERLAARVGVELHYEDGGAASDHGNRARLLAANKAAEEFFRAQLDTPEAQPGREFLGGRGFDRAAADRFGVGFAPKSFSALDDHLRGLGFAQQELLDAGLLSRNDRGSVYDRFRGRLIWPIRDVTGQTVGFGARKLLSDDEDKGPKYLNTPETSIYRKSQVLYGLDLARKAIATTKQVVVVEGYTDVMACHLAGIATAIATCGTALTVEHIKVIRRVLGDSAEADTADRGEVIFTFDPDEAGQRAASRAFAEEQRFAAQTFVAVAPDNLDPCDLRLHRGEAAVRALIETRRPMFEFMIRRQLAGHDLETVEGRVAALRASAPIVAGIRDRSLSAGYVRSLAGWLGMDPPEVGRAVTAATRSAPRGEERRAPSGTSPGRPVPDAPVAPPSGLVDLPTDPATRGERDALMAILQHPVEVGDELLHRATEVRFSNASLGVVRDAVAVSLPPGEGGGEWVDRVAEAVPAEFASLVRQLAVAPIPTLPDRLAAYCESVVADLVVRDLLRRRGELVGAMQRAQADGDRERWAALSQESAQLEMERRRLRRE